MNWHTFRIPGAMAVCMIATMVAVAEPALEPVAQPADGSTASYMKAFSHPADQGGKVELQIATRRLTAAGKPDLWLVAAVHIGDQSYYDALQKFLNDQPLVLFEGVGRPPFAETAKADEPTTLRRAKSAVVFLGEMTDWYRQEFGRVPENLQAVREGAREKKNPTAKWIRVAMTDVWGNPMHYETTAKSYRITSLGADGKAGGDGANADIVLEGAETLPAAEEKTEGLQDSMAIALGLEFQLNAIDYDHDHFVNSDLSVEDMQRNVSGQGGGDSEISALMDTLQGKGFTAGVARFVLRFVKASPQLQGMMKVMLIELFGEIGGDISVATRAAPQLERMMQAILHDRNDIVVRDVQMWIGKENAPKSIAVFYGAAHMSGIEESLAKLGYKADGEFWTPAITVVPADAGLTQQHLTMVKAMVRQQVALMRAAANAGENN